MMIPVQVSAAHKVAVVPFADAVRNLFPDAQVVDLQGTKILVPHLPVESFMLRKLGYDVPSPVLSSYDWPHPDGEPPFHAQRQTCAMLTMNNRAYVLNSMGTGKTRSALWAWDFLNKNGLAGKMLVVAPLSTLKFTWAREVFRTLPGRKVAILFGANKKKRLEALNTDADIYLINHDGLRVVLSDIVARRDIDTLTIDELAVYRNGGAQRTKQMIELADKKGQMKWVWGMTGSPMPTVVTDVYAQAKIITPDTVPKYFGSFRGDLMIKIDQFKYVPKNDAIDRAFAVLQPAVRFTLDDVMELPETVVRYVDVEMGKDQERIYKEMAATCAAGLAAGQITAANAGAVMSKLIQIACGWVYTQEGNTAALDNDKRIEALMDAIASTDRKVLVFSPFKHALAGVSAALEKEGIEHATVSGDTPAAERDRVFNLFQSTPKFKVINAHPQCLAHGITLTAADTIIWYAPITSLEIYDQANARISRVGQKHKQLVLHLQSTPVERKVYSALQKKQDVQGQLLSMFEAATAEGVEQ